MDVIVFKMLLLLCYINFVDDLCLLDCVMLLFPKPFHCSSQLHFITVPLSYTLSLFLSATPSQVLYKCLLCSQPLQSTPIVACAKIRSAETVIYRAKERSTLAANIDYYSLHSSNRIQQFLIAEH